jgi:hypothetical protein
MYLEKGESPSHVEDGEEKKLNLIGMNEEK